MTEEGYIRNCVLIAREGEYLWVIDHADGHGHLVTKLDGYAIIPHELYDELRIKAGQEVEGVW